jgi:colanic acid biosynthesis glycosyl transferase WcaI
VGCLVPVDLTHPSTNQDDIRLVSPAGGGLARRNILVVGINYAPEPTGIAPYTTRLAEHLAARGAHVEVLTGLPHYPGWQVAAPYRGRWTVRDPHDGSAPLVRRLWHHVPAGQSAASRTGYELTFLAHALLARPARSPELVVAVTPALGGAVAAARIARRHDAPLLTVVQDLVARAATQSGIPGGARVADLAARLEGFALRRADTVALVSDAFRDAVRAYGVDSGRVALLPNWTHITPSTLTRDAARDALGWPAGEFVVMHTGNMGLKQDLGTVIEAARHLPDGVRVLLVGDGSQRRALQHLATGLSRVQFVSPLDDDAYPLALAAADVLLVSERPTVRDMSLPSKLTSYLAAGRPILAAVSPGGATAAELARAAGAARVVAAGDPTALARAVVDLRDAPAQRGAMGRAAARYARSSLCGGTTLATLDALVGALLPDSAQHGARRSRGGGR